MIDGLAARQLAGVVLSDADMIERQVLVQLHYFDCSLAALQGRGCAAHGQSAGVAVSSLRFASVSTNACR